MKPNRDYIDDMDLDKEWIHTEVLGNSGRKSNLFTNIVVVLVLICVVVLVYFSFKDKVGNDNAGKLDNTERIAEEQQEAEDKKKAEEERLKQEAAEAELKKKESTVEIYKVKAGDTLSLIAAKYNVELQKLIEANDLKEPYNIEIDQELKIPGVAPAESTTTTTESSTTSSTAPNALPGEQNYTVKAGDTLAQIGAEFGIPYLEIAKLNGMSEPYNVEIGQVLRIPPKPTAAQ